jgi:hypothetical protein
MSIGDATKWHQALGAVTTDNNGNFFIPCNLNVDVEVILGGTSFSMSSADLIGPVSTTNAPLCDSTIVGIPGDDQSGSWILGSNFLRNVRYLPKFELDANVHKVYTVFDFSGNQLRFGQTISGF